MPLYEYHCADCDKDFEVLACYAGRDHVHCPDCEAHLARKVSGAHAQFKGTGFHCTDYGKDGPKNETSFTE